MRAAAVLTMVALTALAGCADTTDQDPVGVGSVPGIGDLVLSGCTARLSSSEWVTDPGFSTPPGWERERPSGYTTLKLWLLTCDRASYDAIERGPVHFLFEGHDKYDVPDDCAQAPDLDLFILQGAWTDLEELVDRSDGPGWLSSFQVTESDDDDLETIEVLIDGKTTQLNYQTHAPESTTPATPTRWVYDASGARLTQMQVIVPGLATTASVSGTVDEPLLDAERPGYASATGITTGATFRFAQDVAAC